mmetsp:Transcript_115674/g.327065  ORF Transcript_115674/g.327065 Transcript_115674/m.327065 type:complete len:530 (-) Transcript_115674:201-1790(-)
MASSPSGDSPVPYIQVFLFFTCCVTVWELYLDIRQLRKNKETAPPAEIKDLVPIDRFTKSQLYQVDKRWFSMLSRVIGLATTFVEVVFLMPLFWDLAKDVVGDNEYYRSIMWYIMTSFAGYPINIPLELYGDFVIEARHGFNKKTLKLFVTDTIKNVVLSVVFTIILVPVVIYVIKWGGEHFYFYIWLVAQCLIFIFMFIYPTLIMPLFNKYEKLHDDALRGQIEELAAGLKFPLTKLFQMDGSKRSSHSNAFMFGFWKNKRIVLFDTLLQTQVSLTKEQGQELGFELKADGAKLKIQNVQSGASTVGKWNEVHMGRNDELKEGDHVIALKEGDNVVPLTAETLESKLEEFAKLKETGAKGDLSLILEQKPYTFEEILAVLCHEIGHWFHGHVLRMLVISSVHIFVIFRLYAFAMYSGPLFQSFGFSPEERSIMVGLSIFMLMFSPVETVVGMAMTVLTRMNEYQADDFAVKQNRSEALGTCLRKLCVENLGDLNPDPLYAWFHHSHPSLVERLQNMKAKDVVFNKKTN